MQNYSFDSVETAFILGGLIESSILIGLLVGQKSNYGDTYPAIEKYIDENGAMHFRQNLMPCMVEGFTTAATQWKNNHGFLPKCWDFDVLPKALAQVNREFGEGVSTECCYRIMTETLARMANQE